MHPENSTISVRKVFVVAHYAEWSFESIPIPQREFTYTGVSCKPRSANSQAVLVETFACVFYGEAMRVYNLTVNAANVSSTLKETDVHLVPYGNHRVLNSFFKGSGFVVMGQGLSSTKESSIDRARDGIYYYELADIDKFTNATQIFVSGGLDRADLAAHDLTISSFEDINQISVVDGNSNSIVIGNIGGDFKIFKLAEPSIAGKK